MSMTLPPTGTTYDYILNGFFGVLPEKERQDLWAKFLEQEGLKVTPPDSGENSRVTQFMQYVQSSYVSMQRVELSPYEIGQQRLIFTVFDFILLLAHQAEDTMGVEANLMNFYGKWREQYAEMQSRVPLYFSRKYGTDSSGYTLSANMSVIPETSDVTKITDLNFGYNDITVTDIANYMATASTTDATKPVIFDLGTSPEVQSSYWVSDNDTENWYTLTSHIYLEVKKTFTGTPPVCSGATLTLRLAGTEYYKTYDLRIPSDTTKPEKTVTLTNSETTDLSKSETWSNAILSFLTDPTYLKLTDPKNPKMAATVAYSSQLGLGVQTIQVNQPLVIPWRDTAETYNLDTGSSDYSNQKLIVDNRNAINQKMQQYIDNIRTKSDTIKSLMDRVQSLVDSTHSSRKGYLGILEASIKQLRNILGKVVEAK